MAQGERLEARGKWRKAEKIYHRELSSRLEDVRVYLALVRVYGGWNRLERGIAFFSERLHEGGSLRSLGALHYAMGLLYKAKGDPERAREEYLEAIELLGGKLELPEESGGT
jgi:tetratricopeptide (TPR) repeat protein